MFSLRQCGGGILTKAHDLRDEERIDGIRLGLADGHPAKGV